MKTGLILNLIMIMTFVFSYRSEAQTSTLKEELAKAQTLAKQGNTSEASKIYTGIMANYPDNREAVQGWLMTNMKREPGGEEDAIKQLEELSKSYPNNTGIIFFKAFLNTEYKHHEEALKDIEKLIKVEPDNALNYILKGQVSGSMQNYKEAVIAFEKATALDPSRPDVWGMKAGALAKTGDFDNALVAANKGLEIAPDNPTGIYNRACIYCLKGDKTNALTDLKKAISMNPSFKKYARQDEDFKNLYDDEDFKKITL